MELRIPDFFLLGKYPDQVDFDQPSDGRSRSAATASTSRSNSSDSPDIEVIGQNHQQTQKKRKMSGTGANAIPLGPEKRFRPNEPFTGRPPPPQPFIRPPPGVQQQFPPMAPPNIHRPAPPQMPPFHAQEQQARQFFPPRHCVPPPPQPPQFFTPPPQFAGLPPPPPLACEPLAYVIEPLISSRHILLRWKFPENINAKVDQVVDNQKLTIQGPDGDIRQLGVGKTIQKVFEVIAGRTYSVTLEGFDIHGQPVAYACGQMRASFSRNDMEMVLRKAKAFCGERMYPFEVLHRCKPKHYWDEIYNSGPDRIMHPYRKDENGHPGCPINGAINGLFFSTLLKGKNLPNDSPFGDIQMVISAGKLLDFRQCNMYFADFYCNEAKMGEQNNSSALHYVTVLVCRQGSTTDLFCKAKQMIPLDWSNNPFLQVRQSGSAPSGYQYLAVCREYSLNRLDLLVEVYYTEPVSLFDADEFNDVYAFGKGQSRPEGLPNNKQCKHCNVYDVRRCVKCQAPFPLYHGDMFDRCPGCDPISNRPSIFA